MLVIGWFLGEVFGLPLYAKDGGQGILGTGQHYAAARWIAAQRRAFTSHPIPYRCVVPRTRRRASTGLAQKSNTPKV
ncbi:MAG: hypothetical protein ACREPT_02420 [Rudaea sp.]